jgi:hypothetical protein
MTNNSWELRWFFQGEMPQVVKSWFENMHETRYIIHENSREDHQLLSSKACENIGIKIREERLELKWRKQSEPFSLSDNNKIVGTAENWLKWVWVSDQRRKDEYQSMLLGPPKGPTVKIIKKRDVRIYQALSSDNRNNKNHHYLLKALQNRSSDGKGCLIEITDVAILDRCGWSIAFESFGSEDPALLQMAANQYLSTYMGPGLTEENSYGYPHWINSVMKF